MTNDAYDPMFDAAGKYYNVDPALLKTVFHMESGGNTNTPRGSSGEIGPMQLMPGTANQFHVVDPTDMTQAIPAAAQILRRALDANGGNPAAALQVYNGGATGPTNPKTFPYVMKAQQIYPGMKVQPQGQPANPFADAAKLGEQVISGQAPPTSETANPFADAAKLGESIISQTPAPADIPATATGSDGSIQTARPGERPLAAVPGDVGAGFAHGLASVYQPLVGALSRLPGVAAIDQAIPALGALDRAYSPNPDAEAAYQQQYGTSIPAKVGNFVGQTVGTLPATIGIGAAGTGANLALRTSPVLPNLVGNSLGRAALIGSGAAAGATGAQLSGGDPLTGAVVGGALPGIAPGIAAIGKGGNALTAATGGPLLGAASSFAAHMLGGDPYHMILAGAFGPALAAYATRHGAEAALKLARALGAPVVAGLAGQAAGDAKAAVTGNP